VKSKGFQEGVRRSTGILRETSLQEHRGMVADVGGRVWDECGTLRILSIAPLYSSLRGSTFLVLFGARFFLDFLPRDFLES